MSVVSQADPTASRRRQKTCRQLPGVESVRTSGPTETVQISVLRHLQAVVWETPRRHVQVSRLCQAALCRLRSDAQTDQGNIFSRSGAYVGEGALAPPPLEVKRKFAKENVLNFEHF